MSKPLPIEVSALAAADVRAAEIWWRDNRSKAPGAIRTELERASSLIALRPQIGTRARNIALPGVRRLHLARIRYDLYYRLVEASLASAPIDPAIVERFYQTRAIRRIGETFEKDHARKSLIVMATGAGKTRTVIGLCDVLMRANWAKRVLFLADRVALVRQAVNAFKKHLPAASPVNLVTEKDKQGRVYVSTYPTMMGLIDDTRDGQRRFGVGHFDLVIIDEAHRFATFAATSPPCSTSRSPR